MRQPHKHHEGEITVDLCQGLIGDFAQISSEIPIDPPVPGYGWDFCRGHWLYELEYAATRLHEVIYDIRMGVPMRPEYHGKIIDNCLSIKDDFNFAKVHNFVDPQY